jgi:hypothetical protein
LCRFGAVGRLPDLVATGSLTDWFNLVDEEGFYFEVFHAFHLASRRAECQGDLDTLGL